MGLRLSATLNGEQRHWLLERSPTRLGRATGNTIQLLDGTVSKEHAELSLQDGRWTVRDLGSRNGTRVNGREAQVPLAVSAGDRVEVGHVLLQVTEADTDDGTKIRTAEHVGSSLSLSVNDVLHRSTVGGGGASRVLQVLTRAGQLLVLPRPLDETCQAILGLVEEALPTSRAVMLLRDARSGELRQAAARYRGGRADEPLAVSQTILKSVLAENRAVITSDAANDPRFLSQKSIIAHAIHSAMAVPLFDNEKVLGILYADSSDPRVTYGQTELEVFTLLGHISAGKITNARLLEAEQVQLRMAHELATATRMQRRMLHEPPVMPGWLCHARIEPCHEVGGDLYDLQLREDGGLVVLAGDVSGKGMGAAFLMSSTLSYGRALYNQCADPLQFVTRLNTEVQRDTEGSGSFVTLFVGFLDPGSGRMRYVNAGHPPPFVVRGGRTRALDSNGIPIGLLSQEELARKRADLRWQEHEVVLERGETLALYSDGIPEAQHGDEFFEFERLAEALGEADAERDMDALADRVIARIDEFAAGEHRADDVTLVLLRRE